MILDTNQKVINIHLRRMVTLIVYAAIILVVVLLPYFDKEDLIWGLGRYHLALISTLIYLITVGGERLMEYNYIYFTDEKSYLTLRYFSLGYLNRKKLSIEIPKNELKDIKLVSSLNGFKTKIIITREVKGKEAIYPAVSLTILNKKQIAELNQAFDYYVKKNMK